MYEIWLTLNILFELALANAGLVIAWLAALIVLTLLALRSGAWRRGLPAAILIGAVVAAVAFVMLPGRSGASFGELRYWLDWASLVGFAAGFGGAAALLAWPLAALFRRQRPARPVSP